LSKTFQKQSFTRFDIMEHTNESFTLDFTQKSEDSKFVAQMLAATNVIPSESIQFQTLGSTNPSSKTVKRCFYHSIP
jgi:hypothetical protein